MSTSMCLLKPGRAGTYFAVIALFCLVVMPSAGLAEAKSRGGGGGGGGGSQPADIFTGTVNDLSTLNSMDRAKVECLDTNQVIYSNAAGGWTIYPQYVSYQETYTVQASGGYNSGYWRHNWYTGLPASSMNFFLPRNTQCRYYDGMHFSNTPYATIGYPDGWHRAVTNYGYGYGPYCSPDHLPASYDSVGMPLSVTGGSFAMASTFMTTGVSSSVSQTQTIYDIEEAWITGGKIGGTAPVYNLQEYLTPTDAAVAHNLPFGDIWVERGRSFSGTVIETGSITSSDGRLGMIGYQGKCPDNYRNAQITISGTSARMLWTVSVPYEDPDSYPGRGGHWFRIYYEGAYTLDQETDIANGVIVCHVWCVDALHSTPPPYALYTTSDSGLYTMITEGIIDGSDASYDLGQNAAHVRAFDDYMTYDDSNTEILERIECSVWKSVTVSRRGTFNAQISTGFSGYCNVPLVGKADIWFRVVILDLDSYIFKPGGILLGEISDAFITSKVAGHLHVGTMGEGNIQGFPTIDIQWSGVVGKHYGIGVYVVAIADVDLNGSPVEANSLDNGMGISYGEIAVWSADGSWS